MQPASGAYSKQNRRSGVPGPWIWQHGFYGCLGMGCLPRCRSAIYRHGLWDDEYGRAIGIFSFSVAFGYLVVYFHSYNTPIILLATMVLISALLFLRINATSQLHPAPEAELTRV